MSIFDNVLDNLAFRIAEYMDNRGKAIIETRRFREGNQPKQLKVRTDQGQFDDNIIINFTGLVEDRTLSQMFGEGIELDFEGDDKTKTEQELFIDGLKKANKFQQLIHNAKQYAGDAGIGFFKIIENGIVGDDLVEYPRIVTVDPANVKVTANPDDIEVIDLYTIVYVISREINGKEKKIVKKQEIERSDSSWIVVDSESLDDGKTFTELTRKSFDYCPMIHWQNLPWPGHIEGQPDIKETDKALQNRLNFVSSNISKIVRLYAHPMRYVIGGKFETGDASPDSYLRISDPGAAVGQFEPLGDLNAAMSFLKFLKQCYFDITRTVDIDSLEDKLGSLTNFALKVIYQDNESKINTMRLMMEDAIVQLLMRCQRIAGLAPLAFDVVWPEFVPVNPTELTQSLVEQNAAGLVDKETAIIELGRDPQAVKERLDEEKANSQTLGGDLLRQFLAGKGQ